MLKPLFVAYILVFSFVGTAFTMKKAGNFNKDLIMKKQNLNDHCCYRFDYDELVELGIVENVCCCEEDIKGDCPKLFNFKKKNLKIKKISFKKKYQESDYELDMSDYNGDDVFFGEEDVDGELLSKVKN